MHDDRFRVFSSLTSRSAAVKFLRSFVRRVQNDVTELNCTNQWASSARAYRIRKIWQVSLQSVIIGFNLGLPSSCIPRNILGVGCLDCHWLTCCYCCCCCISGNWQRCLRPQRAGRRGGGAAPYLILRVISGVVAGEGSSHPKFWALGKLSENLLGKSSSKIAKFELRNPQFFFWGGNSEAKLKSWLHMHDLLCQKFFECVGKKCNFLQDGTHSI